VPGPGQVYRVERTELPTTIISARPPNWQRSGGRSSIMMAAAVRLPAGRVTLDQVRHTPRTNCIAYLASARARGGGFANDARVSAALAWEQDWLRRVPNITASRKSSGGMPRLLVDVQNDFCRAAHCLSRGRTRRSALQSSYR
jgi:hypothetical protein